MGRRGVLQNERIDAARDSRHRSAGRARSERCIRVATLALNWRVAEALGVCFSRKGLGPQRTPEQTGTVRQTGNKFCDRRQVGLTERLRATLDVSERVVQNFTSANSEQQESRLKRDGLDRKNSHRLYSADSCTAGDVESWWNAQRFVSHSAHST